MTPNTELSDEHVRVASPELHQQVDEALGLQAISIRLPKDLIDCYKAMAQERGIGYQPLMRQVLLDFAASPAPLREADEDGRKGLAGVFEEIAREWDGCFYENSIGGDIDIGQAIREAGGKLLRSAAPSGIEADGDGGKGPARLKDHLIAQTVNALVETCRTYGHTQQLRERIAGLVVPLLKHAGSPTSPPIGKTEGDAEGVKASSESQPTGEEFDVANRLLDILMREAHGTTAWPAHWMEVRGQLLAAIRNAGVNPSRGGEHD